MRASQRELGSRVRKKSRTSVGEAVVSQWAMVGRSWRERVSVKEAWKEAAVGQKERKERGSQGWLVEQKLHR